MKKVFTILLSLSLLLALAGCGASTASDGVTTTAPRDETQVPTQEKAEETQPSTETPKEEVQRPEVTAPTPKSETKPEQSAPVIPEPEQLPPQHTHSYIKTTISPTCTQVGYTMNTCDCGAEYKSNEIAVTGHKFSPWHTIKEPTYETTGLARRECGACQKAEDKTIGKLVQNHTHSYVDQITVKPTCSTFGWRQYTCDCGETYGEAVGLLPHSDTVIEQISCYSASYMVYTCKECGDVRKEPMNIPASHNFKYIERETTCTQDGYRDYICTRCGYIYFTEPVKATGHNWQHGGCETYNICTICAEQGKLYAHSWNSHTGMCEDCGKNICAYYGHNFSDTAKQMCSNWCCNACSPEFTQLIEGILAKIITPGMSDLQKVLAIHDYIINNTKYDYENYLNNTVPRQSHLAVGPLMYGVAVCDGYARAFKLLCEFVDVECVFVMGSSWLGGGHAWNQVKVGGKWYNIDVCWDDPDSSEPTLEYEDFLVSDERFYKNHVKDRYTEYYTCGEDHPEEGFKRS